MAFLHAQRDNFHQAAPVGWFTRTVQIGHGDLTCKLFNGIHQHGARTGMQAVFVTHHVLCAQQVIRQRIVAGQQGQHRRRVCVQQFFSFIVQQQIAQTLQHGYRLIVRHGDRYQHRGAFAVCLKGNRSTADRDSATQVAFSTVVQPDALTQV